MSQIEIDFLTVFKTSGEAAMGMEGHICLGLLLSRVLDQKSGPNTYSASSVVQTRDQILQEKCTISGRIGQSF